jgi:outer membrane immunogenic protein
MKSLKKSIMNKLSYVILFVLLSVGKMLGQGSLPHGKNQLNIGLGLSEYGAPIYLGFDHGASRDFTLGAEVSFRGYRENWHKVYYRHNITTISGNANYHFNRILNIPRKWDLYGGLNVGFTLWSSPNGYDGTHSSGLGIGAQIGTRYYLNNKIGLNLEFGNGSAFYGGKFGLTFKL